MADPAVPYITLAECNAAIAYLRSAVDEQRGKVGNGLHGALCVLLDARHNLLTDEALKGVTVFLQVNRK